MSSPIQRQDPLRSQPPQQHGSQPGSTGHIFSAALASSQLDMTRQITGQEMAYKSQLKRDKKRIEATEAVEEASNGEDTLYETVHKLSKKLEKLSELERRAAGL